MYLILVIAHTGQGKTTFVKEYLKKASKSLVFDVNNEYSEHEYDEHAEHARFIGNYKQFIELVKTRKNTVCVFEEATGFFKGRISQEMTAEIIKKRHSGNQFLFLFHSIQRVPKELIELCNYIVLFKTNDIAPDVAKKNPKLLKPFLELQQAPRYSKKIIQLIAQ